MRTRVFHYCTGPCCNPQRRAEIDQSPRTTRGARQGGGRNPGRARVVELLVSPPNQT
ncbi:hypothetical protein PG993_014852 [Apiospora rasikravindrae]|uniref:Uncharacterized protein n=1 Tax=Apiospora rasikravindrae TaxID=990691 RepID=A0ABR1RNY7_9PEZI